MSFGVYIPVGPSTIDMYRVDDLIDSIVAYEPAVDIILLIDHGNVTRDFTQIVHRYRITNIRTIRHWPQRDHGTWKGAGCATNLIAIDYISARVDVEFILKLDTDALIISPFAANLHDAFTTSPHLGIVGTLGTSCNRETRTYIYNDVSLQRFKEAFAVAARLERGWGGLDNKDIVRWNLFDDEQCTAFANLCNELGSALPDHFNGEHCQGGAYGISRTFISRMESAGYLRNPKRWLYMPIDEDKMMGAYCACVGLKLGDLSEAGQPFGVQNVGLAFTPGELIDKGYGIVHSLRNNRNVGELEIRAFFKRHRKQENGFPNRRP